MRAMEISLTGLDVEWRRLEIIAQNIANAGSMGATSATAFRARHLVSGPKGDFEAMLGPKGAEAPLDASPLQGVRVYGIEAENTPPHMVYEPENPLADSDGYVAYPDIDQAGQMTLLIKTSRIYEANIVAMNAARQIYSKALELGKQV